MSSQGSPSSLLRTQVKAYFPPVEVRILSVSIKDKNLLSLLWVEKKKVIGESCNQTSDSTVIPSLNAQVQLQAVYFGHEQGCSFTPQVSSCLLPSDRGSSLWSKLQCVAYQLRLITMLP